MPSSTLDLQNTLEVGDDAREILTCRTILSSVWMPSSTLDLQNTLEVGDDALEILTCRLDRLPSSSTYTHIRFYFDTYALWKITVVFSWTPDTHKADGWCPRA
jgi:hypothetical protein